MMMVKVDDVDDGEGDGAGEDDAGDVDGNARSL